MHERAPPRGRRAPLCSLSLTLCRRLRLEDALRVPQRLLLLLDLQEQVAAGKVAGALWFRCAFVWVFCGERGARALGQSFKGGRWRSRQPSAPQKKLTSPPSGPPGADMVAVGVALSLFGSILLCFVLGPKRKKSLLCLAMQWRRRGLERGAACRRAAAARARRRRNKRALPLPPMPCFQKSPFSLTYAPTEYQTSHHHHHLDTRHNRDHHMLLITCAW